MIRDSAGGKPHPAKSCDCRPAGNRTHYGPSAAIGAVLPQGRDMRRPVQLGVNLPWFHGAYGHDLGPNQACPDWPVAFDPGEVERLLDQFAAFGVRLLRIWLFEQGEGLRHSPRGRVEELDVRFLRNLERLCGLLSARGMAVYWTLLDANSPFRNTDRVTYPILTDPGAAEAFCALAAGPVLEVVAPTAWAIDMCNEPEGIIAGRFGNGTPYGVTWPEVTPSLRTIAAAVRRLAPQVRVSVGSGFTEQVNLRDNGDFLPLALELDFLDYHSYKRGRLVLPRTSCLNAATAHLPVVLGELGYGVAAERRTCRNAWAKGQEDLSGKLHQIADRGYEAAFLWFASDPGNTDATSLYFRHEPGRAFHTLARLRDLGGMTPC